MTHDAGNTYTMTQKRAINSAHSNAASLDLSRIAHIVLNKTVLSEI